LLPAQNAPTPAEIRISAGGAPIGLERKRKGDERAEEEPVPFSHFGPEIGAGFGTTERRTKGDLSPAICQNCLGSLLAGVSRDGKEDRSPSGLFMLGD